MEGAFELLEEGRATRSVSWWASFGVEGIMTAHKGGGFKKKGKSLTEGWLSGGWAVR